MYDVIIIGGGPAGLQAALTLGRMHRDVLLLDSGHYRNGTVEHAHNYATHDGIAPAEFRRLARADLAAYDTVEVRETAAEQVERDGDDLVVRLADGVTERAAALVLATGVRDALPDVPGLADAWGKEIAACPFCHGHEVAGRRVALDVEGAHAERLTAMLGRIGADLVPVSGRVQRVERRGGGLDLTLDDGTIHVDAMFIGPTFSQSAPFAAQLGLALNDSGCVRVDAFQATSMPGVFAAGDAAHVPDLPMPMSSILTSQAAGLVAGAACVQHLLGREAVTAG
jgi:thioredoxin reductase